MKIAIDIRHLAAPNPSGVGRYTIEVVRRLIQHEEHEWLLFASGSARTLSHLPEFSGKTVTVVKKQIPNRLLFALLLSGRKTLEDYLPAKPDLWFFPDLNIIRTKLPYVVTVHDLSFEHYPQFFTRKDHMRNRLADVRSLVQNANQVLAVSRSTKQDLVECWRVEPERISVTPLGVDEAFHPKQQPSDKNFLREHGIRFPYFLSLSTREPRKNIESIIEAYGLWRDQSPTSDIHLVIAGGKGWKSSSVGRRASTSLYKNMIHLIGYVPEKHKPALFRGAEAVLFPSFYEGFGLPVVEAQACGTPVIAGRASSLNESSSILVNPYDISDLVQSFNHAHAIKPVKTEVDWSNTAQKTLRALTNYSPSRD